MCKDLKESSAVQTHINILQNVISRMASNSANSKTWAITIISAIVVLLIDKTKTNVYYIAYVPLVMFFFLDCFYLGLERHFIDNYKKFIQNLNSDKFNFVEVYKIQGPNTFCETLKYTIKGTHSLSTSPFYAIFAVLIFIVSIIA